MSRKNSTKQISTLLYLNDSVEFTFLGDELIFYSETKNGYFGVSGVAVDILTASERLRDGMSRKSLICKIAGGRSLGDEDRKLILDGIAVLLELGIFYEK